MSSNGIKDKVQRRGLNIWFKNFCRGTLEYATGVGKSRCGVLAAEYVVKQNPKAKILILTPTTVIRDDAWRDEFTKWGCKKVFKENVEAICIQTAYKYENQHYDLIIADEIHNYIPITDEYIYYNFFGQNTFDKILGLSASIDKELLPKLNKIAPIVDTIDIKLARELKLVSSFKVLNVAVRLSSLELSDYNKYDKMFKKTFEIFNKDLKLMFACLKNKKVYN